MKRQRWSLLAGRWVLIAAALLVALLPLGWTLLASFGIAPGSGPPTAAHYAEVGLAEPGLLGEVAMSALLAAAATLLTVGVALLAAYGLARAPFRRRAALVQSLLVLASLPAMAYALPLAATLHALRLDDTFVGLVLAEAAVCAPLAVYVLHGYLAHLPPEIEAAARLDGATPLHTLWSVVLPLTTPGIVATALIVFALDWNLFIVPLLLTVKQTKTITLAMSDFFTFERDLDWPTAAAALVVALLPLLALLAAAHRAVEQFQLEPGDAT